MMSNFGERSQIHEARVAGFLVYGTESHRDFMYVVAVPERRHSQSDYEDRGTGESSSLPIHSQVK
jgi:hypothetical protein